MNKVSLELDLKRKSWHFSQLLKKMTCITFNQFSIVRLCVNDEHLLNYILQLLSFDIVGERRQLCYNSSKQNGDEIIRDAKKIDEGITDFICLFRQSKTMDEIQVFFIFNHHSDTRFNCLTFNLIPNIQRVRTACIKKPLEEKQRAIKPKPLEICSICCTALETDVYSLIRCKHAFHLECVHLLIEKNGRDCPNCRCRISREDETFIFENYTTNVHPNWNNVPCSPQQPKRNIGQCPFHVSRSVDAPLGICFPCIRRLYGVEIDFESTINPP